MLDPKLLDDISAKFSTLLATTPARDVERNARAMLSGMLSRLDVVTREEFDVQVEMLARARARIDQLEARVIALEKKINGEA